MIPIALTGHWISQVVKFLVACVVCLTIILVIAALVFFGRCHAPSKRKKFPRRGVGRGGPREGLKGRS